MQIIDEVLEPHDEDIDGVSVGGMDVSDIEDEDHPAPQTSRGPPPPRGVPAGSLRHSVPQGPQPIHQPAPPRYAPRPPGASQGFGQPMASEIHGDLAKLCLSSQGCCLL